MSEKKNGRRNKKNTDIKIGDAEMTYKELLFKMADKKMLTLSADKDGRGLFWAGMDNMEALEKPFDLGDLFDAEDFTHKYPKEEVDSMRETLAESEWEGLKDRDLKAILRDGCIGWDNMSDRDVIDIYEPLYYPDGKSDWSASKDSFEDVYGESDNYDLGKQVEQIICDKQPNEQQGEITAKFNDIK